MKGRIATRQLRVGLPSLSTIDGAGKPLFWFAYPSRPIAIWRKLLVHWARRAASRAAFTAGKSRFNWAAIVGKASTPAGSVSRASLTPRKTRSRGSRRAIGMNASVGFQSRSAGSPPRSAA